MTTPGTTSRSPVLFQPPYKIHFCDEQLIHIHTGESAAIPDNDQHFTFGGNSYKVLNSWVSLETGEVTVRAEHTGKAPSVEHQFRG